jgi:hypothetical protein
MTESIPTLARHDLEAKIVKRCWEDEAFRTEFIADPAEAFTRYLEIPAKDLPKIVIHEEPPGSWHIVLPGRPASMSELSEEELESVAGGVTPTVVPIATVTIIGTAAVASVTSAAYTIPQKGW